MMRTFRFAAKASPCQHRRVDEVLGMSRELYNAGLQAWRDGHRRWKHNPLRDRSHASYYDNCKTLTQLRAEDEAWAGLSLQVGRGVLFRLDRTIRRFYEGGGYPRFKGHSRWRSIDIQEATASMIQAPTDGGRWHRLKVKGLPQLRFDASRMDGELKQLRIVRTPRRLEIHAACEAVLRLTSRDGTAPDNAAVSPTRSAKPPKQNKPTPWTTRSPPPARRALETLLTFTPEMPFRTRRRLSIKHASSQIRRAFPRTHTTPAAQPMNNQG